MEGTEAPGLVVVPALFEHAVKVYESMHREAREEAIGDRFHLVYEGHLTNLFKRLRLSVPYYTDIKNRLIAMGCIEQLRRGGGNGTSKWILWKLPTLPEWQQAVALAPKRGNKQTVHDQQIKDLNERLACQELLMKVVISNLDPSTRARIVGSSGWSPNE